MAESYREMGGPELVDELRERYGISIEEHLDAGYLSFYFLVSQTSCIALATDWREQEWSICFETTQARREPWFEKSIGIAFQQWYSPNPKRTFPPAWMTASWDDLTGSNPEVLALTESLRQYRPSKPGGVQNLSSNLDHCAQLAKLLQQPGVLQLPPPIVPPPILDTSAT